MKLIIVLCVVVFGMAALLLIKSTALKTRHPVKLEQRVFKVEPVAFYSALRSVSKSDFSNNASSGNISKAALAYFKNVGVNLAAPGRSVAFNDRLSMLFVKATPRELDTVERAVQALNQVAPQIHIKARFIEVPEDNVELILKTGVAVDAKEKNTVEIIAADKMKSLLRQLESTSGVETLAEPEVVTTSSRQTQMRSGDSDHTTMDLYPALLADNYTLNLRATVSKPETLPETLNAQVNIWDGQTLALIAPKSDGKNRLVIFITAMVVDPAGNRLHSDDELQKMKSDIPPQT
ncbi:MAG TPA: hypothetical protein VE344_00155 [Methylomirabilota bacterium]|nr:hypothetical protein [Methylomirabilota bacterium]